MVDIFLWLCISYIRATEFHIRWVLSFARENFDLKMTQKLYSYEDVLKVVSVTILSQSFHEPNLLQRV